MKNLEGRCIFLSAFPEMDHDSVLAGATLLWSAHTGNRIIAASDAFGQLTGFQRSEIVGKDISALVGPDTAREAVGMIDYLFRMAIQGKVHAKFYDSNQSGFCASFDLRVIRDATGNATYFAALVDPQRRPSVTSQELISACARQVFDVWKATFPVGVQLPVRITSAFSAMVDSLHLSVAGPAGPTLSGGARQQDTGAISLEQTLATGACRPRAGTAAFNSSFVGVAGTDAQMLLSKILEAIV